MLETPEPPSSPGRPSPSPPLPGIGGGAPGQRSTPPPRTQLGRHSPHPEKPCGPVPTLPAAAPSRAGGRLDCNTNLAIEGFHSLHVVGAEARSPAAEEAAATALGGESETGAAARPRGGGAGRRPDRCDPGQQGKGKHWRGRAPSGAARPRHGR